MRVTEEYAEQWDVSAKYFYDRGYYKWMASAIENHDTVVEIGCGTGYSSLSLIENGHRVIAVEKNKDCIEKVKRLLQSRNVTNYFSRRFRKEYGYTPSQYRIMGK